MNERVNKIRRIVVELDPAKDNGPALARARALAASDDAAVDLFVCEYLQWLSGDLIFAAETVEKTREEYLSELASWADSLGRPMQDDGLEVNVQMAWRTPKYEALLEHADAEGADWIVRVARNRGKLERMLLTATDWELIRRAKQVLWLVKSSEDRLQEPRILVSVDPTHSEDPDLGRDRHLLDTSVALSKKLGAELHVFHAWAVPVPTTAVSASPISADVAAVPIPRITEETFTAAREKHRQRLDSLLAEYSIPKSRVHLVEGSPGSAIRGVIDEHDIDIVVAGAVSRTWLQRLLIGSTAETLFEAVNCDLVIVKDKDDGGPEGD